MALLAFLVALCPAAAVAFGCGECMTIQEGIHRSIVHNITALEKKATLGTTETATVQIGQIIWHMCDLPAWQEQRHHESLEEMCQTTVRQHVDVMTNYWKEKASDEYKDPLIALRMKRAVCVNPEVGACELEQLPSDYEPLRPDECAVCRALVGDLFGVVRRSRERPRTAKNDNYFRLLGLMSKACEDLPMRHAIRPNERNAVVDLCDDLWDEHESKLSKLALAWHTHTQAERMCSDTLDLCEEDLHIDLEMLPVALGSDKAEL